MSILDKITPGPWTAFAAENRTKDKMMGFKAIIRVGSKERAGNPICEILMGGMGALYSSKEDIECNAKAIAAVPDLLSIVERFHKWYYSNGAEKGIKDIAIAADELLNKLNS